MTNTYTDRAGLRVNSDFVAFIESELLNGLEIAPEIWWAKFASFVGKYEPRRRHLLERRDSMQHEIDIWALSRKGQDFDLDAYIEMLETIGWLCPDVPDVTLETDRIDPEIGSIAGPQLVVPISNARYALNAANARWASLYDALYSTDAIPGDRSGSEYDPERGSQVIAWGRAFLDDVVPLASGSHADVTAYTLNGSQLNANGIGLKDPEKCVGWRGDPAAPSAILLRNNGLHIEIEIDEAHPIGASDKANVKDICLEAALSVIMDAEDSVAAIDAADKIQVYRNWLGLMRGDLTVEFKRGENTVTRGLNPPRHYSAPDGQELSLRGLALLMVRNVGELMTTPTVYNAEGQEISESHLDLMVTATAALHDMHRNDGTHSSGREGSLYIVKPKLQGPEEVAYVNEMFATVEDALGLSRNTLKIGLMDEEKRTSANLRACIAEIRNRLFFINTGFLDRTGNEIFHLMEFGPIIPKQDIKSSLWLNAYEARNVEIGLACGLHGKAQIGKGMWAAPDQMADMLEQKMSHPKAAANTAWVPSPVAAVLHATHYHRINVMEEQAKRLAEKHMAMPSLRDLLTPPLAEQQNWAAEDLQSDLDNNAQGLLGYIVRWVNQGIGCSKVPDINNVGLMEDRATLRISSQQISNWLHHGLVSKDQVMETLERIAQVVDDQNADDPDYEPLVGNFDGPAFQAAVTLALHGKKQPSGYTEPVLHQFRRKYKAL